MSRSPSMSRILGPAKEAKSRSFTGTRLFSSTITWEQSLRGFDRIHLKPGETKTVTFPLSPSTLGIWNRDMVRVVEPGEYEIQIGASSTDLRLKGDLEIR